MQHRSVSRHQLFFVGKLSSAHPSLTQCHRFLGASWPSSTNWRTSSTSLFSSQTRLWLTLAAVPCSSLVRLCNNFYVKYFMLSIFVLSRVVRVSCSHVHSTSTLDTVNFAPSTRRQEAHWGAHSRSRIYHASHAQEGTWRSAHLQDLRLSLSPRK